MQPACNEIAVTRCVLTSDGKLPIGTVSGVSIFTTVIVCGAQEAQLHVGRQMDSG